MAGRGKPLSEAEKAKREEAKATKFREVGTKRLNNALHAIRMLIPLANKAQYNYTPEQVSKINTALSEATTSVRNAFDGQKVATGVEL
jgi:hypothetical protein